MNKEKPSSQPKAALVVAERQLALLGELAAMAMGVSRAFAASAISSAQAEERILADEYFTPEVGRARGCGAKDAAESFQKVSRAVRLTLKLELAVAETVDDLRQGRSSRAKDAGETPAVLVGAMELDRRRLAGSASADDAPDRDRYDSDRDCLVELERSEVLFVAPFRETVDRICTDLGATMDWTDWRIEAPATKPEGVVREPASWRRDHPAAIEPETPLPP